MKTLRGTGDLVTPVDTTHTCAPGIETPEKRVYRRLFFFISLFQFGVVLLSPFLLRCRMSLASFSVTAAGATTSSSLLVMACCHGDTRSRSKCRTRVTDYYGCTRARTHTTHHTPHTPHHTHTGTHTLTRTHTHTHTHVRAPSLAIFGCCSVEGFGWGALTACYGACWLTDAGLGWSHNILQQHLE